MHTPLTIERMNRFSICENDRVLSNPAIFVNRPVADRAGTDRERLHILCGQLQLRTCILAAAILVGLLESGLQVLTLGALVYLPLGKLHIATSENAASTQKSECFSTETTVYHRFRSVVRSFILGWKQRAPENVR